MGKVAKIKKNLIEQIENMAMMWYIMGRLSGEPKIDILDAIEDFYKINGETPNKSKTESLRIQFYQFREKLKNTLV